MVTSLFCMRVAKNLEPISIITMCVFNQSYYNWDGKEYTWRTESIRQRNVKLILFLNIKCASNLLINYKQRQEKRNKKLFRYCMLLKGSNFECQLLRALTALFGEWLLYIVDTARKQHFDTNINMVAFCDPIQLGKLNLACLQKK